MIGKAQRQCVAALVLGALDTSKFDARAPQGFFARNAAAHQILGEGLDMEAQLRIHLAFHARAPHRGAQPRPKAAQHRHPPSTSLDFGRPAVTGNLRPHSYLSATIGSTFIARRAGK